jgi:hypothetical protein
VAFAVGLMALVAVPSATARHKPSSYRVKGHISKQALANAGGGWCFGATWMGNGGWTWESKQAQPDGEYINHTNLNDTGKFSWDLDAGRHATAGLGLCRLAAGLQVSGGDFGLSHGTVRSSLNVNDVYYQVGPGAGPPTTTTCSRANTQAAGSGDDGITSDIRRTSVVFVAHPAWATFNPCDGAIIHPFSTMEEARSVAIPDSVLNTAKEVIVTISSPTSGGEKACGQTTATYTCTASGIWQGTLTLIRGRNG